MRHPSQGVEPVLLMSLGLGNPYATVQFLSGSGYDGISEKEIDIFRIYIGKMDNPWTPRQRGPAWTTGPHACSSYHGTKRASLFWDALLHLKPDTLAYLVSPSFFIRASG